MSTGELWTHTIRSGNASVMARWIDVGQLNGRLVFGSWLYNAKIPGGDAPAVKFRWVSRENPSDLPDVHACLQSFEEACENDPLVEEVLNALEIVKARLEQAGFPRPTLKKRPWYVVVGIEKLKKPRLSRSMVRAHADLVRLLDEARDDGENVDGVEAIAKVYGYATEREALDGDVMDEIGSWGRVE